MIEIAPKQVPGLHVGNQADYETKVRGKDGWAVVHACKEPYHRQALGYAGQGAPKDHPEYLIARRGDRLILNLVDVNDARYVRPEIVDAAVRFIAEQIDDGKKVLVHCNQGMSRSPTIALLFLAPFLPESFDAAEKRFRELYPPYAPAMGMHDFAQANWLAYRTYGRAE